MLTLLCSAALPCAAAPEPAAARADAGWILQKLARPAPMRTAFVELRGSPMLKAPLRIEGEYRRPDNDTLVREVRSPYAETTTLRNGQATLARAGKTSRTFALSRVPELAGLQASFGALLAGDRALLEQHYRLSTQGTRQQWTLVLVPRDAQVKASVRDITLYGRGAELRCIETRPLKGDLQRTLMAGAAHQAAKATTATALAALCRAGNAS
ncbi:fatty acyl CoA synthetase [Pseudoxanthomonas gei]|uniref:Fatty acyl CoA synthetase n=2 Tax=Pseudoxanthomonas gei TaxID=1383030 RepID=A0ABX0AF34_9GAMM|nr:LolA-related protein [Pseudoxanthomonas gei]NDK40214.1 fatty acyl CoA synthetase [Pseudoxanthomonas gei]